MGFNPTPVLTKGKNMTDKEEKTNLDLWDSLSKTDPDFTKKAEGKGYSCTAINPTYVYKKLTDRFGACGIGWGYEIAKKELITTNEEMLIFVEVDFWYVVDGVKSSPIRGCGGDFVVRKQKSGTSKSDDDALKKATTDALTNAAKMIGCSADVHLGMYEDSKYVNQLKAEKVTPEKQLISQCSKIKEEILKTESLDALENYMLRLNEKIGGEISELDEIKSKNEKYHKSLIDTYNAQKKKVSE